MKGSHFDLLIVDLNLEGESGLSLIENLRHGDQFARNLHVLLMSSDDIERSNLGQDDRVAVISKKISPIALNKKIQLFLK